MGRGGPGFARPISEGLGVWVNEPLNTDGARSAKGSPESEGHGRVRPQTQETPWSIPCSRIDLHIVVIGAGPRFQVPRRVGGKESAEELHHGFTDCVDFGVCQLREHRQAEDLFSCRFGYWQISHPLATRGEGRLQV